MTQEEKKILLKELSARLPYGVYCKIDGIEEPKKLTGIEVDEKNGHLLNFGIDEDTQLLIQVYLSEVRPYLRLMSSMTKEELKYLKEDCGFIYDKADNDIYNYNAITKDYNIVLQEDIVDISDFCYSNHLDYRCLIDKGLALEASSEIYKNEDVV